MNNEWQIDAVKLANTGVMSWRDIARQVNKPKSTVSDFLRSYYSEMKMEQVYGIHDVNPQTTQTVTHLYIPDNQVRPGISLEYLRWIGEYIVRKTPTVIVLAGDFGDMPSLSSYDKGKRSAEGKRVQADIDACKAGLKVLWQPLLDLQEQQRKEGKPVYNPRKVITLGNHEDRIDRHVNANPELHGFLSINDLGFEEYGIEVVPFLTPIEIDGIAYCHYFPNVMTGKPLGGTAATMMKTIGQSFSMGHRQQLDIHHRQLPTNGARQWGLIAGAAYVHDEEYKGKQGNHHWRGIVLKHNVKNGGYDPLFVSMEWLQREFGE